MAKHKYHPKNNLSPLEEARVREQERLMEEERQRQILYAMQSNRLEEALEEQEKTRVRLYPYAVACIGVLVMLLYLVVKGHCFIDLPLLILLAVLTAVFLWLQLKENQKLCDRMEEMLEERRHS